MLADFRDWLKANWLDSNDKPIADHYHIGKINNNNEKSIGIYSTNGLKRVEAFGKNSSYDIAGISILVHWNKNANDTEIIARSLYETLRYVTNTAMGNSYVYIVEMSEGEPISIGTDDNGVYEYHIGLRLYYRR